MESVVSGGSRVKKRRYSTDIGKKTVNVCLEKADEKMEYGEIEPPNLPSSPVLRTARYQHRKKNFLHSDTILAIHTDIKM